jgi:hypothetical protein
MPDQSAVLRKLVQQFGKPIGKCVVLKKRIKRPLNRFHFFAFQKRQNRLQQGSVQIADGCRQNALLLHHLTHTAAWTVVAWRYSVLFGRKQLLNTAFLWYSIFFFFGASRSGNAERNGYREGLQNACVDFHAMRILIKNELLI